MIFEVLKRADVPIDTRLHYREYGWASRRVNVPKELEKKLDTILKKRSEGLEKYRAFQERNQFRMSTEIVHAMHKLSEDVYMEIHVTEVEGDVEFAIKMTRFYADLRLFNMQWNSYNIHTGQSID